MSDKIQLYSLATPNGQKIGVALEEMGFEYDAHLVNILKGDQFKPEFLKVNPNGKIPAIVDPKGPSGSIAVFESGAILIYLAEKSGKFLSQNPTQRIHEIQWLMFQMGGVGPMFGQFGHFYKYAGDKCDHPYPVDRYTKESKRLLGVIDKQLSESEFIAGKDLSIADFSIFPWILCLDEFYKAKEYLELDSFANVNRWLKGLLGRPKVQSGLKVCAI